MSEAIGQWVRRERTHNANGAPLLRYQQVTMAHRVETFVNDDPISRCGRKLKPIEGTELVYGPAPVECFRCRDRFVAVAQPAEDSITL